MGFLYGRINVPYNQILIALNSVYEINEVYILKEKQWTVNHILIKVL